MKNNYQTIGALAVKYPQVCPSGDHTGKVLPVPIPNTEVKLFGPMIVHTSVKVGIAGFLKPFCCFGNKRVFFYASKGDLLSIICQLSFAIGVMTNDK